jgi:hypothetical protein
MFTHHITGPNPLFAEQPIWLDIASCTKTIPTSPRPSLRVALAALDPCSFFAELRVLADCLICTPSTASHVTNGTSKKAWQPKEDAGFSSREAADHIRIAKL